MAICSSSCFEFLWVTVFEFFSLLSKPLHTHDAPPTPSSCSSCYCSSSASPPSELKVPVAADTTNPPDNVCGDSEAFVELDPTGRYGRYNNLLGQGSTKRVYRGFDQIEGIEIAWNKVVLKDVRRRGLVSRLNSEVGLLRALDNESIIKLFSVWGDEGHTTLNFITEACTSGNLREYRKKHTNVSMMALKKWSKQILRGLEYLHTRRPCVIHRDLNCSNVFVNGNIGQVKIGDFGLAATVDESDARSVYGTPEFMAPELYQGDYTESVDIYAFGMSLLEMVTMEIPYSECTIVAQVMGKVTKEGGPESPEALSRVDDPEFKAIIVRCLAEASIRPSASQLLRDPFFLDIADHR